MYEESIFSPISPSRKGRPPSKVIEFKEGVEIPQGAVPRFEMFRGIEGEILVNLNQYRGIEDLGDRIAVKAGTTWREVLRNYQVELYGNMDYTVGGTLFFDDPIFGFNEFGYMRGRVEVYAFNGAYYQGKYSGGVPAKVIIRKESKKLVWREWSGSLASLLSMVRNWYTSTIPTFRDVSIVKDKDGTRVIASYPESREVLLKQFLTSSSPSRPFYDSIASSFYYEGETSLDNLTTLQSAIEISELSVVRIRRDRALFSISSQNKIIGVPGLKFSIEESIFNGCILCGACVEDCPHGRQRGGNIAFTPLGFYILQAEGKADEVSNCNLCGKCMEVCPVKLDIVDDLRKFMNPSLPTGSKRPPINDLRRKINVVLTPLSTDYYEYALRTVLYLSQRGIDAGFIFLNVNPNNLVKGKLDFDFLLSELVGTEELITVTPEDQHYLQPIKAKKVLQIEFIGEMLLQDNPELVSNKMVHLPCLLHDEVKADKVTRKCSTVFLNQANREGINNDFKADITLCINTAKAFNIPSILDAGLPELPDLVTTLKEIISKSKGDLNNIQLIMDDLSWLEGVNDEILQKIQDQSMAKGLEGIPETTLKLLYVYMPLIPSELRDDKLFERIKSAIINVNV